MSVNPIQAADVNVYADAYCLNVVTLLEVVRELDGVVFSHMNKERESKASNPVAPRTRNR